jgi:hypothetical protein
MKNTSFNTNDIKRCCENKLDIEFRPAKEFNGLYFLEGKKTARITVSKGRKFVPPKTYKSMAKQLKLTVNQFDDLLECPLIHKDYKKILSKIVKVRP